MFRVSRSSPHIPVKVIVDETVRISQKESLRDLSILSAYLRWSSPVSTRVPASSI